MSAPREASPNLASHDHNGGELATLVQCYSEFEIRFALMVALLTSSTRPTNAFNQRDGGNVYLVKRCILPEPCNAFPILRASEPTLGAGIELKRAKTGTYHDYSGAPGSRMIPSKIMISSSDKPAKAFRYPSTICPERSSAVCNRNP